ncbi:Tc1-mariner class transposase [Mycena sanguinolenta]|uniref:Tc1-mariner class transposase n=1 Tax=Mycena sanguinolenta TaxID=230812 RepID=A0A8H6YMD7_9AGAR|nr:Tc1-mariner class transposase [Mycena sanguinolenta]
MGNCKISADLKDAALRLWELGWSEEEIMQGLVVSRASLYRWKQLFEEIGSTTRPPSPLRGRPRIITQAILSACLEIYQKEPDTYLDELRWHLAINHDIVISISALQDTLVSVGLTRKLLHRIARERTQQLRDDYWNSIDEDLAGDSDMLVMADETSKNNHTLARKYGRAPVGMRAPHTYDFVRGPGYTVAAAMSKEGYLAVKVLPGAFDSFDFFDFVAEQVLPVMNPWPAKHSVLVLDNCRIHHNDALLELLSANGSLLLFLPPYSPDLNPIEESFSTLKAYMRRHGSEMLAAEDPVLAILEACACILPEMARNWFIHAGYR